MSWLFFYIGPIFRTIIWYIIRFDVIIKIHSLLFSYESMTVTEIIQFTSKLVFILPKCHKSYENGMFPLYPNM